MTALASGLSGLIANQRKLDVVGNNLANLNTTAFKARRTGFSDLLYQTIKPATGTSTSASGLGAVKIGSGVRVSTVGVRFSQGTLQETGGQFDMAIDGDGMFILNGPAEDLYTRDGGFQLDSGGFLIDSGSGYSVQRLGTLGETGVSDVAFQTPGDPRINIPFGTQVPGTATTNMELAGNLDADAEEPEARILQSANPFVASGVPATTATLLNDLDSILVGYVGGDSIEITGTDGDGSAVNLSFPVDGTTTLGDFVTAIDGAFSFATASLDTNGSLQLTADAVGESLLSLEYEDNAANTGSLNMPVHSPLVHTGGQDGATVESSLEVYDAGGSAHTLSLTYQKVADNEWSLTASLAPESGTVIDGQVTGIRFNENGAFQQVDTLGVGNAEFTFQFAGQVNAQDISVSLGTANQYDGVTQVANQSTTRADQNGFPAGTLTEATISTDGIIEGLASNGRSVRIAQLAMASFYNPGALDVRGENHFARSTASGPATVGAAASGDRGVIRVGQLEASNVDVALEFTQLILAQRGFSASARTITVTDEMLQELNGIIR